MDTGKAWVSAGAPLAPGSREDEVAARFAAAARAQGRRSRFFAVERDGFGGAEFARLHLGEQPFWDPRGWPAVLRKKRSLREQLRRARAKGVQVRCLAPSELAAGSVRRQLDELVAQWKRSREMAPMRFLVQIDLDSLAEDRLVFVAEREQRVVAVLGAIPIPACPHPGRTDLDDTPAPPAPTTNAKAAAEPAEGDSQATAPGWFLEDLLRRPDAPNGTIELLIDHGMRTLAAAGCRYVTSGLAPLAHTPSPVLAWIRDHTRWLYHFDGLRAFKAKLLPDGWQPVYLAYPRDEGGSRAVLDSLRAFAGGSFWRFGLATLRHRAPWATHAMAFLLPPWITAMAVTDTTRWFPSLAVKLGWIGYDIVLFGLLLRLAARWRKSLATVLAGAAALDFSLGSVEAALYNLPRARGAIDYVVVALALGAPLFASIALWLCRDRERLYLPARARGSP